MAGERNRGPLPPSGPTNAPFRALLRFNTHTHLSHHTAALSSALVAADATNVLCAAASLDHRLTSGRHDE